MMYLPERLEKWIMYKLGLEGMNEIGERGFKKKIEELREILFNLSETFIHKRCGVKEEFEERFETGYLAFFSPLSYVKTFSVLREVLEIVPPKEGMRIIDLGAGQGAGTLAAIEFLKNRAGIEEPLCVDRRKPFFNILEGMSIPHRFKIMDIEEVRIRKTGEFDLVLMVNSLTEAYGFDLQKLWSKISLIFDQLLAQGGLLVIIEPAMKDSTRTLMNIRNKLVQERDDATIIAPCINIKECPMLKVKSRNEWCHFSVRWKPPYFMEVINRELGRELDVPKFSYLAVFKGRRELPTIYLEGGRVVSNLQVEKGKKRFYLCRDERYIGFERLDRDLSERNRCVDEISKGDIVKVDEERCELKGGRMRILKDTYCEILRKFA